MGTPAIAQGDIVAWLCAADESDIFLIVRVTEFHANQSFRTQFSHRGIV